VTGTERIDQQLAVKAARAFRDGVNKDLRTRMRALPVMIQTNGLAATAAFLLSRAGREDDSDPYWRTARLILNDAATVAAITHDPDQPKKTLVDVSAATGDRYVLAETRARLFAGWLSRLAQALADSAADAETDPDPGGEV
jgi:CRISPR type III-B/RAMP module-associated protein Cmr5